MSKVITVKGINLPTPAEHVCFHRFSVNTSWSGLIYNGHNLFWTAQYDSLSLTVYIRKRYKEMLSQMNPVYILTSYFFNIHCNIFTKYILYIYNNQKYYNA